MCFVRVLSQSVVFVLARRSGIQRENNFECVDVGWFWVDVKMAVVRFGDLYGQGDFKAGTEHVSAALVGGAEDVAEGGGKERAGVGDGDAKGIAVFCKFCIYRYLSWFVLQVVHGGDEQVENGVAEFFAIGGDCGEVCGQDGGKMDATFGEKRGELLGGGGDDSRNVAGPESEGIGLCVVD